jgi:hypothetical protein
MRENVWATELAAGVDLLNVDDLADGRRFLLTADQAAAATGRVSGRT